MSEHHDGVTLADVAVLNIWGKYAPAIERWAGIVGRPAPAPTDDGGRLSADFVEWMMGYRESWVTSTGISRTGQLKALGNAIVPMQAAAAWSALLGLEIHTHTHTPATSADPQNERHERTGEPRQRRTRLEDRLLPTPTTHTYKESGRCRDWGSDVTHAVTCKRCNP